MRRSLLGALAAVAVVAVPAGAMAQRQGNRGPGDFQRMLETNPLWEMLDVKDRLQLSDAQVKQLKERATALDKANEPKLAKVREMRAQMPGRGEGPPTPEARERIRAQMESMRPVMQAIRDSHQKALQDARGLLSDPQKSTLDQILEEWRQQRQAARRGPPPR